MAEKLKKQGGQVFDELYVTLGKKFRLAYQTYSKSFKSLNQLF